MFKLGLKEIINYKMNLKFSLFLVIILFFTLSCYYTESNKVTYFEYFDEKKEKIKSCGELVNGSESGLWKFYDLDGKLIQEGNFENGIPKGTWIYYIDKVSKSISWKEVDFKNGFNFGIPVDFEYSENLSSKNKYHYFNKIDECLFGIDKVDLISDSVFNDIFELNYKDFINNGNEVKYAKSKTIEAINTVYKFDEFLVFDKFSGKELTNIMIYSILDSKLITLSFVCNPEKAPECKVLIEQIYFHIKYKDFRVYNPFEVSISSE